MKKVHAFYEDMLGAHLILYLGSRKECIAWARKKWNLPLDDCYLSSENGNYFTIEAQDDSGVLARVIHIADNSIGVAVHESVHAAYSILNDRNIPVTCEDNECLCYLSQWICDRIFEAIGLQYGGLMVH